MLASAEANGDDGSRILGILLEPVVTTPWVVGPNEPINIPVGQRHHISFGQHRHEQELYLTVEGVPGQHGREFEGGELVSVTFPHLRLDKPGTYLGHYRLDYRYCFDIEHNPQDATLWGWVKSLFSFGNQRRTTDSPWGYVAYHSDFDIPVEIRVTDGNSGKSAPSR
jgi:hypothetical protein